MAAKKKPRVVKTKRPTPKRQKGPSAKGFPVKKVESEHSRRMAADHDKREKALWAEVDAERKKKGLRPLAELNKGTPPKKKAKKK
jgi:hypothetical protein